MKFSSHKWNFITNVKPKPDNIASKIFLNLHSLHYQKKKKGSNFFKLREFAQKNFTPIQKFSLEKTHWRQIKEQQYVWQR